MNIVRIIFDCGNIYVLFLFNYFKIISIQFERMNYFEFYVLMLILISYLIVLIIEITLRLLNVYEAK